MIIKKFQVNYDPDINPSILHCLFDQYLLPDTVILMLLNFLRLYRFY